MIPRLPSLSTALLALSIQADFCDRAQAQLTVVPKTASASSLETAFGLAKAEGEPLGVTTCSFDGKTEPCQRREESVLPLESHPQNPMKHQTHAIQAFQVETVSSDADRAVSTAVLALFRNQIELGEAFSDAIACDPPETGAQIVNIFQLSETLEWRVEPGGYDVSRSIGAFAARYMPANQVGVFASRTLFQKDENTSVKIDAGVNVDTSGAAAGKAGLLMAW
jgi:hypothetical protein